MSVVAGSRATATTRTQSSLARVRNEFRDPEKRTAYLMVLPALLVILLIAAWPVIYSAWLSFLRILPTGNSFIGIANYVQMFTDGVFLRALLNTVVFTVFSVVIEFGLGLCIALVLNRGYIGQGVTRAIAIVPWAFPTVVSGIMWRLMYQDQVGILAYWGENLRLVSGPILANENAILIGAILSDVWKTTPFVALLLLAGLQVISPDVYEAARADGATPWQQFTRITLPLLKPAIFVALLFRTLDAYRVYDLFWVLSDRQLDSLSTYTFEFVRISQANQGRGPAASVFVFLSSLAIAFVFIRVFGTRAREGPT
jgi:trehalose/maltose transport system permease protein